MILPGDEKPNNFLVYILSLFVSFPHITGPTLVPILSFSLPSVVYSPRGTALALPPLLLRLSSGRPPTSRPLETQAETTPFAVYLAPGATMAPGVEFTLSLGHIPLITFTLRQWHFHFNARLALPYPAAASAFATANIVTSGSLPSLSTTPHPIRPIPSGFHCRPFIEIRFAL